eukprot:250575-Pleurochrysis_carterae.AAC.1
MRFALGPLQAATQLVEVLQLEEEGAVREARAIVGGPAKANREAVAKLRKLQQILPELRQRS